MAVVLLIVGAVLLTAGATLIFWPAGVCVAGLLSLAAGVDMARTPSP